MTSLLPAPELQFCDANGNPMAGASLYTYIPGTTTPKQCWLDANQSVLQTNPVVLDSAGRCILYGAGAYRLILKDALGITIYDQLTSDATGTTLASLTVTALTAGTITASGAISGLVTATGATTARSLAAHFSDVMSVIDFGADKSGVTDSTAAFNAAIAACDYVYVPAGIYLIAGTITISSDGVRLVGAGMDATYLTSNSTTVDMITNALALDVITISDMTLTRSVTATAGGGIHLLTINQAFIERVRVTKQFIGFKLGAVAYGVLDGCVAQFNKSHGFSYQNDATHNTLQWSTINCLSQENDGWGFAFTGTVNTAATTIPISPMVNCTTFANTGGGVVLQGSNTAQLWDFQALGCWFGSDNFDELYFDTYGGNHFVKGSYMELAGQVGSTGAAQSTAATHTGNAIEVTANNQDVNVLNCGMESISQNGVTCTDNLFTLVSGCVITAVGLAGTTYAGVVNNGVGHMTVTGSRIGSRTVGANTQAGIQVADGALLVATGNDLRANSAGAINMTANYAQAVVTGNAGYVSRFGAQSTLPMGATTVVVTHNLTLGAGQTPIQVNITPIATNLGGRDCWVSALTQTTFTINISGVFGADAFFAWTATTSGFA